VLVLLGGRAKVSSYTEDGSEVILAVRTPEDLLGEVSAIDGLPHSATVAALEPIEAVAVDVAEFRRFLETTPRVALVLLETTMARLRDADRKRIEFGAYDSVGRVARRLLELAERFGEGSPERVRITLPLSQQELAGWVGASREAVSKALHVLWERGLVQTGRRSVTVLDPAGLRRRAM
jgi:CRP/FNR family transcriptional regulator, cyclic AMP receptor protein